MPLTKTYYEQECDRLRAEVLALKEQLASWRLLGVDLVWHLHEPTLLDRVERLLEDEC